MATKKNTNLKKNLALGGAVLTGVAALAGAFFLYGTKAGTQKRKAVKGWALKAKGELLEKIENIKDLTEDKYIGLVDSVMGKYYKLKDKYGDDVELLSRELKSYWASLQKQTKTKTPIKKKVVAKKKVN